MAITSPKNLNATLADQAKARYRQIRQLIPYETGNYPYVTARVRAKRALLIPNEAWERLLLMEVPEIARFLGERSYKEEMIALGGKYSGVDLIEMATSRNLAQTFTRIYGYSQGSLRTMVGWYLDRFDLQNVKTIVRAKASGAPTADVQEDLVPAGSFDEDFLDELVEAPNLDAVFKELEGTIYATALSTLEKNASEVMNWSEWEDRVSRLYYVELLQSIPPSTDANRLMRRFVQREIDLLNLKTLLRVWDAKGKFEREIFLEGGEELSVDELHELLALDLPNLQRRLADYAISEDIAGDLDKVEQLGVGSLLRRLEKRHLMDASRYAHLHPLSILPILDFIVRKEREVQNIRIIARGKESGLSTQVLRDLLVL